MADTPELILRYMRVGDVSEVTAIDRASFTPPWPASSYRFEINESNISYMVVLEQRSTTPNIDEQQMSGWRRLFNGIWGPATNATRTGTIVGYGGLWNIADEAHISTIASHPDFRGRKFGEIVLIGMIRRSIQLGAGYLVLEVRVSNTVAQRLYEKYQFTVHGVKKEYYHHDREDAYDMRIDLTDDYAAWLEEQYAALTNVTPFRDIYSHTTHPRLAK